MEEETYLKTNLRAKKKTKKHKPKKENKIISEDSRIQKAFVRYQNQQMDLLKWKLTMINFFKSLGMTEDDAEEELKRMIENHKNQGTNEKENDEEDPIPEEEINEMPRL